MIRCFIFICFVVIYSCNSDSNRIETPTIEFTTSADFVPYVIVLGNVQDAGSPHAGCRKDCCKDLFQNPDPNRMVTCLGLVDPLCGQSFLLEASPDLPRQMKYLKEVSCLQKETPDGIFLTHGHIGHYTGLMYLGKESMNAKGVPVYAMPRMTSYLEKNGPWDQLVKIENILLNQIDKNKWIQLTTNLKIQPFVVPHRDEYSETVGFRVKGPNQSFLFIPDIDKWEKWDKSIIEEVEGVDLAFLDATFYDGDEINNRDISQIPHPFVIETTELFSNSSKQTKRKIQFIHINHTNPLLNIENPKTIQVLQEGFQVASFGKIYYL